MRSRRLETRRTKGAVPGKGTGRQFRTGAQTCIARANLERLRRELRHGVTLVYPDHLPITLAGDSIEIEVKEIVTAHLLQWLADVTLHSLQVRLTQGLALARIAERGRGFRRRCHQSARCQ